MIKYFAVVIIFYSHGRWWCADWCMICPMWTDVACPPGKYGAACRQNCYCENSAECDSMTGQCHCVAGWTGTNCSESEFWLSFVFYSNLFFVLFLNQWSRPACWFYS